MLTRGSLRIRGLACAAAPVLRRAPRRGCPCAARCAPPPLARALGAAAAAGDSVTLPHATDAAARRRAATVARAGAGGQPHAVAGAAAAGAGAAAAGSRDDVATFASAGLSEPVAAALRGLGFAAPTSIQARARGCRAAAAPRRRRRSPDAPRRTGGTALHAARRRWRRRLCWTAGTPSSPPRRAAARRLRTWRRCSRACCRCRSRHAAPARLCCAQTRCWRSRWPPPPTRCATRRACRCSAPWRCRRPWCARPRRVARLILST
jgi:hypothetical protein